MPMEPVRIGLLWHSMNSDNLGVGALTIGHMEILRDVARGLDLEPHFEVIGWTDPKPPYFERQDIDVTQLTMRDFGRPGGLLATARRCDIVFDIGAGDSFADIYGASRILKMLAAQNIILAAGCPLVLSPQTIGPFRRPMVRRLALNVMRRARAVATRDRLSTDFAREMGFRGALIEASDVALRLPYEKPSPRGTSGPTRIGINVSGLLFNGGYTRNNMFGLAGDYATLMRNVVARYHDREDCEIHLVGHVITQSGSVEDDRAACQHLADEFPGCVLAPAFADPSAAKSYIAGLDFFSGARMHACIAAFSSGVPVLPMAYSRKFEGLFGTLGYRHGADCKADDNDTVLAKFDAAFNDRVTLKAEAETALKLGLEKLSAYEATSRRLLTEIRERNAKARGSNRLSTGSP